MVFIGVVNPYSSLVPKTQQMAQTIFLRHSVSANNAKGKNIFLVFQPFRQHENHGEKMKMQHGMDRNITHPCFNYAKYL